GRVPGSFRNEFLDDRQERRLARLGAAWDPLPPWWWRGTFEQVLLVDHPEPVGERDGVRQVDGAEAEEAEAGLHLHGGPGLAELLRDLGRRVAGGQELEDLQFGSRQLRAFELPVSIPVCARGGAHVLGGHGRREGAERGIRPRG